MQAQGRIGGKSETSRWTTAAVEPGLRGAEMRRRKRGGLSACRGKVLSFACRLTD